MSLPILMHEILALVVLLASERSNALPTAASALKYLQRYGYLKATNSPLGTQMADEEVSNGILLFQSFVGLPQTGTLDLTTLMKMEQPRCGFPDILDHEKSGRKKRYNLNGSKWRKNKLTYKITSYTSNLTKTQLENQIARSFDAWERVSSLWFKQKLPNETVDIEMKFVSGDHGDGNPFDGPYLVLAHAMPPAGGGDIHFDNDETWIIQEGEGIKLPAVAAHEIGHSLGISHSAQRAALMYPYYNPDIITVQADDINAIRALYGNETGKPLPIKENVQKCKTKFDAITTVENGMVYAFSKNLFWKLIEQGMEENCPQTIESVWGFRGSVDASLTHKGFTDLFQGKNVRRYINEKPVDGYPKLISEQYFGMPSNIDAAWSKDENIYFVKGSEYWVFNLATNQAYTGYPRLISRWKGLAETVDAAVQWKGNIYFFKDRKYWRFNEKYENEDLHFPQKADKWWPSCSENSAVKSSNEGGSTSAGSTSIGVGSFHTTISFILLTFLMIY